VVQVSEKLRAGLSFAATPDFISVEDAEVLARSLARWQPSDDAGRLLAKRVADARAGQRFLDLFNIADPRVWDPRQLWSQLTPENRLKVPIGETPGGKLVFLDLKESAEHGIGPHGSFIGMTGSGKSEHLLALVAALCVTHPPEVLSFLLGDFKGEATFAPVEHFPHVKGVVSNLEDKAYQLDRLDDVINGEAMRRQQILKDTNFANVRLYEAARARGADLEPLGTLIILFDELAELLSIRPGIAKTLGRVGRLGRALWIHILNASQVKDSRLDVLSKQESFAVCMKVKEAGTSREAMGSPRAYLDLQSAPPGSAFLASGDEETRYRAFYVSGPWIEPRKRKDDKERTEGQFIDVQRFDVHSQPLPPHIREFGEDDDADVAAAPSENAPTVLKMVGDRLMASAGATGHQLWVPPLEDITEMPVDELTTEFWNRDWTVLTEDAGLVVPVAREDDAYRHRQDLVPLDLSAQGGNVAIAGAQQAGKSTALQTIVMQLAGSHSPQRVQFYGIDLGGGSMSGLAALPHVVGIAGPSEEEKQRRVLAEVERLVRLRERTWDAVGLNLAEFRARKFGGRTGEVPEDGFGEVFLMIDNIGALHRNFPELHERVLRLMESQPLNYGVHVLITADQWSTVKPQILNKCGSRIELRMQDKHDSIMDRTKAEDVPQQAGRGLMADGKHMLVGSPRASGYETVAATAEALAGMWAARGVAGAPKLAVLPPAVRYEDLDAPSTGTLKLGLGELEMSTVAVDLRVSAHFLAAGRTKSGRTTLLHTLCASIQDVFAPEEAQIIAFDQNYSLADAVDPRYLAVYASGIKDISTASVQIAQQLQKRRPPAGLTPTELARWEPDGPHWFVVVDDLNLLSLPGSNQTALDALVEGVQSGRQLRFHLFAATTSDSWMQVGLMNRVVKAMIAEGSGVLVMDGDKREKIVRAVAAADRAPGRGELVYGKSANQLIQVALPPGRIVDFGANRVG
jgi:S-DNA-T family DNA segregation ATPase FtsK/SpoIIIE